MSTVTTTTPDADARLLRDIAVALNRPCEPGWNPLKNNRECMGVRLAAALELTSSVIKAKAKRLRLNYEADPCNVARRVVCIMALEKVLADAKAVAAVAPAIDTMTPMPV